MFLIDEPGLLHRVSDDTTFRWSSARNHAPAPEGPIGVLLAAWVRVRDPRAGDGVVGAARLVRERYPACRATDAIARVRNGRVRFEFRGGEIGHFEDAPRLVARLIDQIDPPANLSEMLVGDEIDELEELLAEVAS